MFSYSPDDIWRQFHHQFACVPCQSAFIEHAVYVWKTSVQNCCMLGSCLATNQVHQISTNTNWTSAGQYSHEFPTKFMPKHGYHTSSRWLFPVESIPSFVQAQNFLLDWMHPRQRAHLPNKKHTRNPWGHKWIRNFVPREMSVSAIWCSVTGALVWSPWLLVSAQFHVTYSINKSNKLHVIEQSSCGITVNS